VTRSTPDVAIMMVEAGGTEGSFEKYLDGAPKVSEDVLAAGLEASKLWIREAINLQRELVRDFIADRWSVADLPLRDVRRLPDDVYARVGERRGSSTHRGQQDHDQGRAQRSARQRHGRRSPSNSRVSSKDAPVRSRPPFVR